MYNYYELLIKTQIKTAVTSFNSLQRDVRLIRSIDYTIIIWIAWHDIITSYSS